MMISDNNAGLRSSSRDPKKFHIMRGEPIKLLQYVKDRSVWEVLTPMQLHCELSINTWLNILKRVCPKALGEFVKALGGLPVPARHEHYDYKSNQCAKVPEGWERLLKLLPSHVKSKLPILTTIYSIFRHFRVCSMYSRMASCHGLDYEANYVASFAKFEPLYRKLVPLAQKDP